MSVYKPKGSPFFHFDFQFRGVRFHGTTGCTSRREAERHETRQREAARETLSAAGPGGAAMTVNVAMARFFTEVGQHYRGNYRETFDSALEWLTIQLGPKTLLKDIGKQIVSAAVARRRAEGVKNSTVNRTVTEPLRRVLARARKHWDQQVQEIEWKDFLLAEPKERVRELRSEEETQIFDALRPDYHPILRFALLSGCRLAECVGLRPSDIDWGNRSITIRGKGEKVDTIPLTTGLRELLFPLRGHHPDAVFTYQVQRVRDGRRRGERRPITYEGLKTQWRRCKVAAKIDDFRFHDHRHTAATRLLRESGNLKLVQRLLRHEDIATTTKYAHADDMDLRRAMEATEAAQRNVREAAPPRIERKTKNRP
ncbi:site-specific integrase [Xanthobacter sp. DSM 24535]